MRRPVSRSVYLAVPKSKTGSKPRRDRAVTKAITTNANRTIGIDLRNRTGHVPPVSA